MSVRQKKTRPEGLAAFKRVVGPAMKRWREAEEGSEAEASAFETVFSTMSGG